MRIDHPIQTTPDMIHSLHSAVQESSGSQFAMMMSLMSVQNPGNIEPAKIEFDHQDELSVIPQQEVNGVDFLNTILLSQQLLQAK